MANSVTDKEVYLAIASLVENGVPPDHINVREALGGRGSGPELSKNIDAWYREFGPTLMSRLIKSRAEAAQNPPPGLVAETAGEILSALQSFNSGLKDDPNRSMGDVLVFAFDKIGSLLSKLQAWEGELHREADRLALLKARLKAAPRPKVQSPKKMPRP
ncbi:hypothetical protein [Stenotrophomonas sp. S41]|uniref:hypothetical protein n=1 Tax=Stenotrophomonas sp. S41 TaxID=2767464 RepID=UPI00190BF04F|nr:hypothetical protein [Stenotrophomonas sp. S41]MBK0012090.1 hypothetical protein [Stenotrophomonas sp. S41]